MRSEKKPLGGVPIWKCPCGYNAGPSRSSPQTPCPQCNMNQWTTNSDQWSCENGFDVDDYCEFTYITQSNQPPPNNLMGCEYDQDGLHIFQGQQI